LLRSSAVVSSIPTRQSLPNAEIARVLRELGLFLEMDDVPFKPRAYEKAAFAVASTERPLSEVYREGGLKALDALPSVGHGIAERIASLLETGHIADLDRYREKYPVDLLALTAVEGVGPKSVRALYEGLGIRDVAGLKRAASAGEIHELTHFGERSEKKILAACATLEALQGRRPLADVLELAGRIEARLAAVKGVKEVRVAGSVRRRKDTIGDLDLLVSTGAPAPVMDAFVTMPEVREVLAKGLTKSMVRLSAGIDADLRVVEASCFGAALLYFTGSKAHNVALRRIAQKKDLKLSEYGLFRNGKRIAGKTEQEIFHALGLGFIPPELREDSGEIEAARQGRLPRLVEAGDLRGDLQVHTKWTDGAHDIRTMAKAAMRLGREYLAITDHTRDLAMARGLDEARLEEQRREIREVQSELSGIRLLCGAEVNIRPDGSLDVDDAALEKLDLVGAAIHSHLDQPRAQMTRRLVRAVENPHVDVLFHPSCRSLGRRPPIDFDFDAVVDAARRTGTALEIDAQPDRLDLRDELVRRAISAGVRIVIDSDAHNAGELRFVDDFGVAVARRGWAESTDVLNTLPLDELRAALKGGP
jgi:DNA polymerase (family 10)